MYGMCVTNWLYSQVCIMDELCVHTVDVWSVHLYFIANCDQICKNVHSSHIQYFNFKKFGMVDRLETCSAFRAIIPANFRSMYCSYQILLLLLLLNTLA